MTDSQDTSIDNAQDIVQRFGGIRPMASKIGAAVTTVQGWKKRDSIPSNRLPAIIAAAQEHDVDLSDLIDIPEAEAPAEDAPIAPPKPAEQKKPNQQASTAKPAATPKPAQTKSETARPASQPQQAPAQQRPAAGYSTMSIDQQVNLIKKLVASEISTKIPKTEPKKDQTVKDQAVLESTLHDDIIYSITQAERRA